MFKKYWETVKLERTTAVKVLMLMLSIGSAIGPLVYALKQYEWDVSVLFTPKYSPPKVDFTINIKDVRVKTGELQTICELKNRGEVKVALYAVNASVYGPDQKKIAPVNLLKPVLSAPQSAENFTLTIILNDSILSKFYPYFKEQNEIEAQIRGEANIKVFGSNVTAPLQVSINVKAEDLGISYERS